MFKEKRLEKINVISIIFICIQVTCVTILKLNIFSFLELKYKIIDV